MTDSIRSFACLTSSLALISSLGYSKEFVEVLSTLSVCSMPHSITDTAGLYDEGFLAGDSANLPASRKILSTLDSSRPCAPEGFRFEAWKDSITAKNQTLVLVQQRFFSNGGEEEAASIYMHICVNV